MNEPLDIETLVKWGKPREVNTKNGARLLRKARPTPEFYAAWGNGHREALKAAGVSMGQDRESGEWQVLHWGKLPEAVVQRRAENLELSRAAAADIAIPVPDGLALYPFQRAGVKYALRCFDPGGPGGCLIGDDMGLGKSPQSICVINAIPEINRVLVITKASLKQNFARECKKWLVRPLTVGIADSQTFPDTDIVVVNYDVIHKWPRKIGEFYWDLVICDEVQRFKNRNTIAAKVIIGYRPSKKEQAAGKVSTSGIQARRRMALTGTPIENRPEEFWTILNFVDPKNWGSFWGFAMKYCAAQDTGFGFDTHGASNLEELNRITRSTVMIRRKKTEVLTELPPKTRVVHELPTDGCEDVIGADRRVWAVHEAELEEIQARVELAKASDNEAEFKAAIASLREASRIAFTEISKVRHETVLAKLPAAIKAIEEDLEEVKKVLVFAHHTDVIKTMAAHFGGQAVMVTGETDVDQRQKLVDRFQADSTVNLFLGSIRACGEGLNLQAASLVVFVEEDWVPGKVSQCEDRAHRIGTTQNVLVKHLVLPGSIDAKMLTTIMAKQEIIDRALDDKVKVELLSEPVIVPKHESLGTRKEFSEDALLVTDPQREAVHRGLRMLAGMDGDKARELNGMGFSRIDVQIGHSLAETPRLSNRQTVLGRKLCRKYVRQLGSDLVEAMGK